MDKEEKERILKCVMDQIERERPPRRRTHLKRVAAVALASAAIFVCGAFTANVLELDSRLAAILGGNSGEITEAVTDIDTAVEKNGLRLAVKQAVGDGHRVYAVFEVTSLTGLKLDKTFGFESCETNFSEEYGHYGVGFDAERSSVSQDGKTLRIGVEFTMDRQVYDQDVVMEFENFGQVFYVEETKVLIQGTWTVRFPLKYKKVSRTCTPDTELQLKSGGVKLDRIDISPMSCFLEFSVTEYTDGIQTEWEEKMKPEVMLKDGTVIPVLMDGSSWVDNGKNSVGTIEGRFRHPVDMEQLEYLMVDGRKISLEYIR